VTQVFIRKYDEPVPKVRRSKDAVYAAKEDSEEEFSPREHVDSPSNYVRYKFLLGL
jgi:hypothetical protein